jgi:hypothetical protein
VPVPRRRRTPAPRGGHRGGDHLDGQVLEGLGDAELALQPVESLLVGAAGRGRRGELLELGAGERDDLAGGHGALLGGFWQGMRRGRLPRDPDSEVTAYAGTPMWQGMACSPPRG